MRTASAAPGGNTTTIVRRPRAGTMPASVFPYTPDSYPSSSSLAVPFGSSVNTIATSSSSASAVGTRHRSGSATFTTEAGLGATLFSSALDPSSVDAPSSPSVDEDAGGTIVSTLASLGLDDDDSVYQDHNRNNYASLPALSITTTDSSSSAAAAGGSSSGGGASLPAPVRSRAYTVGTRMERPNISRLLAPTAMSFDPFSLETERVTAPPSQQQQQQQQQRPRAISLGMVDEPPVMNSSFHMVYQQQQQQQQEAGALRGSCSNSNIMDLLNNNGGEQQGQQQVRLKNRNRERKSFFFFGAHAPPIQQFIEFISVLFCNLGSGYPCILLFNIIISFIRSCTNTFARFMVRQYHAVA